MPNVVEDIISELESEFIEELSFKNSVMSSDGRTVRINRVLWEGSPVLREHSNSGTSHKVLAAPESALLALIRAHEDEAFPDDIRESYELFDAASELELRDLTSKCFDNLRAINAFDSAVDLPSELSVETVMRVFKVLLDTPLRTADVYRKQLLRIARYCGNNRDVMTNAMNLLKQNLEKFKCIDLEGIPASFAIRTVPVAIYKHKGKLRTAVILGKEIKPVNILGDLTIGVDLAKIRCFHLKYGQYLLYCCGGNVYYKNLQDYSGPCRVLSDCEIFETKAGFVFATQKEHDRTSILLWMDDETFKRVYQCHGSIEDLAFDDNRRVLAVLQTSKKSGKLLLFRLKNESLFFLEDGKVPKRSFSVCLSEKNTFVVHHDAGEISVEAYCYSTINIAESGQSSDRQPGEKTSLTTSENFGAWSSLIHCGEEHFLLDEGGLELVLDFPCLERTKMLMERGELCALSELWMSP